MKKATALLLNTVLVIGGLLSITPSADAAKAKDTVTVVTADNSSVVMGTPVVLTATVTAKGGGGNPTGSVAFTVGGVQIGTSCTLNGSGVCSITYTWNARGQYDVIGTYTPVGDFNSSISVAKTITVTRRPSTTVVVSSKPNAIIGDPLVFTTTVTSSSGSGPTPTGSIILYAYESNTVIGNCTLVSGSCVVNLVATTVGNHRVWAQYGGDTDNYLGSDSAYIYQNNSPKPVPTVTISTSPSPSDFGTAVTITVTASGSSGTPTGSVNIENGEGTIGSCTLSSGACSIVKSNLSVGSHTLTAEYLGDATYDAKNATTTHIVNQVAAATTTTITSSSNPSVSGNSVTFTANVTSGAGTPTGTVKILQGPTEVGTCTLSAGTCTHATSSLPVGHTTMTASYQGVALTFAPSSGTVDQVVSPVSAKATTVSISASVESSTVGTTVVFTLGVTASGSTVTGSVALTDNGTAAGSCTLSSGSCQVSKSFSTVGSHSLVATFAGNETFDTGTATIAFTVNKRPTPISVTFSKNPVPRLVPVTVTITLDASATGSIAIEDNEAPKAGCTITTPGTCVTALTFTDLGVHDLDFEYSGDATHLENATSADLTVGLATTTISVTSDAAPASYGQTINFTATLADTSATGSIQIAADGVTMRTCESISAGTCTVFYYRLSVGTHVITAVYSGDSNFAGATSPEYSQVVTVAPTTTTLTSNENPFSYGSGLTLYATVVNHAEGPSGKVHFEDYSSGHEVLLGECTLSGSTCWITLDTPLSIGTHSLKAEYESDGKFAGSSGTLSQVITAPASSVAVISSKSSTTLGETVTLTVNVAANGNVATGTVQLKDGVNNLGPVLTLSSGSASYTVTDFAVGSHSLTAVYSGDANHAAATSPAITQKVLYSTSVAISAAPVTLAFTDPIVLSSTVTSSGGTPTGVMTFEDVLGDGSDVVLGTCSLSAGACSVTLTTLSVGTHTIYGEYVGAGDYKSGASSRITVSVSPRPVISTPVEVKREEPATPYIPTPALSKDKPIATALSATTAGFVGFTATDSKGRASDVSVSIPAGAISGAATLTISTNGSTDAKGFVALSLKIVSSNNQPITSLDKPLTIKISRQGSIAKPATSSDGITWEAIATVTGDAISSGSTAGYYVGADRSINILTLKTSLFDLLKKQNQLYVQTTSSHINVGSALTVGARGGAGTGALSFSTLTTSVCTVTQTGVVSAISAGQCSIVVARASDDNYLGAISAPKPIQIRKP